MRGQKLISIGSLTLLFLLIGFSRPILGQVTLGDSSALVNLLNTNCPNCHLRFLGSQDSWNTGNPVGQWDGITVQNGRVTEIVLENKALIGDLAPLGVLDSLKILNLNGNHLTSLPSLDSNRALQGLFVMANRLSALPSLDQNTQLVHLYCVNNFLINLPDLSNHSQLAILNCTHNYLGFPDLIPNAGHGFLYIFGPQKDIPLTVSDSVPFLLSGSFLLDAARLGTPQTTFHWEKDGQPLLNFNQDTLVHPASGGPARYTLTLTDPALSITLRTIGVYLEPGQGVYGGDTDNNGVRNMLDMVGIGLNYGATGPSREHLSDTLEEASLMWRLPDGTPRSFHVDTTSFNLKFADSNGDGVLNNDDKTPIQTLYDQPLMLSAYLRNAIQPQFSLRAIPVMDSVRIVPSATGALLIRVPYRIEIASLPSGYSSIDLKGVIFTRAVTEPDNLYSVDTIHAEFIDSDFIPGGKDAFWLQKYHPDVDIFPGDPNFPCLDTMSTHPLDVGVFTTDTAVTLTLGQCIINCIVTLEDVYRPSNMTGLTYNTIPLMLSTINAVAYADSNGVTVPIAGDCSTDTVYLNADSLLRAYQGPVLWESEVEGELLPELVEQSLVAMGPNPVNVGTAVSVEVDLKEACPVLISLCDVNGREVMERLRAEGVKGVNSLRISTGGLRPGIYFLKVNVPGEMGFVRKCKLVVI